MFNEARPSFQSPKACYLFQVHGSDLINTLCIRIAQVLMNQLLLFFLYRIYEHLMKDLSVWWNLRYTEQCHYTPMNK